MATVTAGLITKAGATAIGDLLNSSTADHAIYLAYGTGTTAAALSDTALGTEIDRAEATVTKVGSTYKLNYEFTANKACTISEVGVFTTAVTTTGTPICVGGTTYYLVWDADYDVSATDFIWVVGRSVSNYDDGTMYYINGSDTWTDREYDAMFKIYGKEIVSGSEELLVDNSATTGSDQNQGLRYNAAQTKLAQSFELDGTDSYYITRVEWRTKKFETPDGDAWVEIHSDMVGTQLGVDSSVIDANTVNTGWENRTQWDVTAAVGGGALVYRGVAPLTDRVAVTVGQTYDCTVVLTPEAGSY